MANAKVVESMIFMTLIDLVSLASNFSSSKKSIKAVNFLIKSNDQDLFKEQIHEWKYDFHELPWNDSDCKIGCWWRSMIMNP